MDQMAADRFRPIVAIPARNEAERLPTLLAALAGQSWVMRSERRLPVVVVLNNCEDGSRGAVGAATDALPMLDIELLDVTFEGAEAHVGSARRLGMEHALLKAGDPASAVILTTDADAVPAFDWVDANLAAIEGGADLVGGLLIGDPEEEARLGPGFAARAKAIASYGELCDRLGSLIDPLPWDPWPRHRDHTGASLAVCADRYAEVGGLPALPRREDLALVSCIRRAGGKVRHPLSVRVHVSARLVGRAEGGMAECLRSWLRDEAEGRPILVEAPASVEARLLLRRALRAFGAASAEERRSLARRFALSENDFLDGRGMPRTSADLVEALAPDEPDAPATVPVAIATVTLATLVAEWEAETRAA